MVSLETDNLYPVAYTVSLDKLNTIPRVFHYLEIIIQGRVRIGDFGALQPLSLVSF